MKRSTYFPLHKQRSQFVAGGPDLQSSRSLRIVKSTNCMPAHRSREIYASYEALSLLHARQLNSCFLFEPGFDSFRQNPGNLCSFALKHMHHVCWIEQDEVGCLGRPNLCGCRCDVDV